MRVRSLFRSHSGSPGLILMLALPCSWACSEDGTESRGGSAAALAPEGSTPSSSPEEVASGGTAPGATGPGATASEGAGPEGIALDDGPVQDMRSGGTPPAGEGFVLAWQDDFDVFDASRWQLMTHSWDSNLALFSAQNVSFEAGVLKLLLSPEPADAIKPFRGVEMRSVEPLTYGKVEARARLARGSGVVSSLVLIYTPWPADDWNELDIEYLGRYSDRVQLNAMVYTGPPTEPPVDQSVVPTQFPELVELDFDPSADFHEYAMEWTPTEARFSIDGLTRHVWNADIARLRLPMNILLTIWASSAVDWAGVVDLGAASTAEYDWIRVYRWNPASPRGGAAPPVAGSAEP